MATYRVCYLPGASREREDIEADEVRREGPWLVLRRAELVVGSPRLVVRLRVHQREVRQIITLGPPG